MVGIQPTSEEVETDSEITVKRPDHLHDKYMVFVQDRGPGSRFLPKGSRLLIQQEVCMIFIQGVYVHSFNLTTSMTT